MIATDSRDSTPWWPPEPTPPPGAPNVLLIVLDDVGFAQLGCYGSDIATPNIDALAAEGVRFANFHTTALCSPTRSCLLTGRNHHRNGMARVADLAIGLPRLLARSSRARTASSPRSCARTGTRATRSASGTSRPTTRCTWPRRAASWPLGRGFDRWYGFHGGETHQFNPALYHDNHAVLAPGTYESGYHLSADLADRAIEFLSDLRAVDERAAVLLLPRDRRVPLAAPRAARVDRALQGPVRRRDGTRGARPTFARQLESGLVPEGTELSPRPSWVPAWDELAPEDQAVAARFMECFAGVPLVHRRAARPRARLPRARPATSTTR